MMTDIFANQPLDPTESARRGLRRPLRQRFFEAVSHDAADGGYRILLDGRPVRTPAKRVLAAPTPAIAEALVQEWDAQRPAIDPAAMPLTRLANSILDGVTEAGEAVTDEVAKYLGSDLLFYRADSPERLVARQAEHWDPVLDWMRQAFGARFVLAEGVMFVEQPDAALAAARTAIPTDPWRLGAVAAATTLMGSALLALALAHGRLDAEAAFTAANVDEDWNQALWGEDAEMLERRAARRRDLDAAAFVLAHAGIGA